VFFIQQKRIKNLTRFSTKYFKNYPLFLADCKDTSTLNVSQFFFYYSSQKNVKDNEEK